MATKQRNQNPVIGDTVLLDLFVYNSNNYAAIDSINQIQIFYFDPNNTTVTNPYGKTLVEIIPGTSVTNPQLGEYQLSLYLDPAIYINDGNYTDEWDILYTSTSPTAIVNNIFIVYSDLWYTTPIPTVYDFSFYFQPNKIRHGSILSLLIEVVTNVPTASDLQQYYLNLAVVGQLYVYIDNHCNQCDECDGPIVDGELTYFSDKNRAYYRIDTNNFDCGLYDVWFKLLFGTNTYISAKSQLLIYD